MTRNDTPPPGTPARGRKTLRLEVVHRLSTSGTLLVKTP